MMPGCNSFARVRGRSDRVHCHMKAQCEKPGNEATTLDSPRASVAMRGKLRRLQGRFVSHYRWPCTEEVLWPAPGVRRSLPSAIPSGLVSFDCAAMEAETKRVVAIQRPSGQPKPMRAAFVFGGSDEPARNIPGYCTRVQASRPDVTSIRWPREYKPPATEVVAPLAARTWQGKDVHANPKLFDRVAQDVAKRSFNGREVVLLTSNAEGLPLAINLIANLASFGHRHSLLLADRASTCALLTSEAPPACIHSSLLRTGKDGRVLRQYVSNAVWTLWLQRYLYFRRLIALGLSPLLLDADVVLFRDPYPFLHGTMANYTLFVLCDASAGYAAVNGGVLYASKANPNGPVAHLFAEFERRVMAVVQGPKLIRFDRTAGNRAGGPADTLLYDQTVINNVLLSEVLGREANMHTHTSFDGPGGALGSTRVPSFWHVPPTEWPTPTSLGHYDTRYPPRYALRNRPLTRHGITESVVMAPPWLFSAESDARVPPVRQGNTKVPPGRPAAGLWGAVPPPAVLVHFVCAAWPGSGGRLMAMQIWGKWYYSEVARHLGALPGRWDHERTTNDAKDAAQPEAGFDPHSWLRVCGTACAVGRCLGSGGRAWGKTSLCYEWLQSTSWRDHVLRSWASGPLGKRTAKPEIMRNPPAPLTPLEAWARSFVEKQEATPPALARAVDAASTRHAKGLIAFLRPIAAADRREYQLYVHLLMSAAMLTQRVPVLPLAVCAKLGEWSERSRCVYVMHASDGQKWCVMRPPSPCFGKVALPNALEAAGDHEVERVVLQSLGLRSGSVDVEAFGRQLGAAGRNKRVLLLDRSRLMSADDVSNLLVTPKVCGPNPA